MVEEGEVHDNQDDGYPQEEDEYKPEGGAERGTHKLRRCRKKGWKSNKRRCPLIQGR